MAMALTNSGETQRTGERTGTSAEEVASSGPSLVMRRGGTTVGSSGDVAREWAPGKGGTSSEIQFNNGPLWTA